MQNRQSKTFRSLMLVLVLVLACAAKGYAGDGVIEINQASVDAVGGFPFQITDSGSYRLTGNLNVTATDVDAISINTDNVTIDLNGFTINGPGSGSGRGVASVAGNNITVINGTVRLMGQAGISLNDNSHVERVHALGNGGTGIFMGTHSVVRNNVVSGNGDAGIVTGFSSVIYNNVAGPANGSTGIISNGRSVVYDNVATNNGLFGIYCGERCVIRGNVALENTNSIGINCEQANCVVIDNRTN